MPELPEVHTTVEGIKKEVVGKTIKSAWSDFHLATSHGQRNNLKNKRHYDYFLATAIGSKIIDAERKGKNILIHLNNKVTIVIHMKMTGHLMVGNYSKFNIQDSKLEKWVALDDGPLQDPYNKYIHFVLSLSDGRSLVLSDSRKFASIYLANTPYIYAHNFLSYLGPDPLKIKEDEFVERIISASLSKKTAPIKSLLMDQSVLAGIGNIYSDEILFEVGIHPESIANKVPKEKIKLMYKVMLKILNFSIEHGGDSKSDYRNIYGEKGGFQNFHKVYGQKGKKCPKKACGGIITRIVVRGRSSHFCPKHQILFK